MGGTSSYCTCGDAESLYARELCLSVVLMGGGSSVELCLSRMPDCSSTGAA